MSDIPYGRCTKRCWEMPECATCRMRKRPQGRDPGVVAGNSYCGPDCPGYYQDPKPGHFWPDEASEAREAASE